MKYKREYLPNKMYINGRITNKEGTTRFEIPPSSSVTRVNGNIKVFERISTRVLPTSHLQTSYFTICINY